MDQRYVLSNDWLKGSVCSSDLQLRFSVAHKVIKIIAIEISAISLNGILLSSLSYQNIKKQLQERKVYWSNEKKAVLLSRLQKESRILKQANIRPAECLVMRLRQDDADDVISDSIFDNTNSLVEQRCSPKQCSSTVNVPSPNPQLCQSTNSPCSSSTCSSDGQKCSAHPQKNVLSNVARKGPYYKPSLKTIACLHKWKTLAENSSKYECDERVPQFGKSSWNYQIRPYSK
uniref:Uncharacterized protein n=1 Tax=Ditylenchus dipsaci TaxID=166011 RepID=A0A915CQE5_9BILA